MSLDVPLTVRASSSAGSSAEDAARNWEATEPDQEGRFSRRGSTPSVARICGTLRLDRVEVEVGEAVRVFWDIPGVPHNRFHWIGMFDAGACVFDADACMQQLMFHASRICIPLGFHLYPILRLTYPSPFSSSSSSPSSSVPSSSSSPPPPPSPLFQVRGIIRMSWSGGCVGIGQHQMVK